MVYTANGKRVTASTYQAYKLMNDSVRLMHKDKSNDAIVLLERAIKLDPNITEAHEMLGMALARIGKTDQATDEMRIAIVTGSDMKAIASRLNLASVYQANGDTQDAIDAYRKILNDCPNIKVSKAIEDRVKLLEREMKRRHQARVEAAGSGRDLFSTTEYVVNVTGNGRKRWPASAMPIRVYVYPGEGLSGWRSEYNQILRDSFDEWEKASNGKIRFKFQNIPHDADIVCTWIDDPKLLESSAEGGETQVQTYLESIVKAKVLLSLNDAGSLFPYTDNLVRTLCLHELGHGLGLIGHSGDPHDVMYCSTPIVDIEQHLSPRDKATLNSVYSTDVDNLSQLVWKIDQDTHGNTVVVIRSAIIGTIFVAAVIITLIIAIKKASKTSTKKKKKK